MSVHRLFTGVVLFAIVAVEVKNKLKQDKTNANYQVSQEARSPNQEGNRS